MTNKESKNFLIFDFDNTLVDTFSTILKITKKIVAKEGFGLVTEAQIKLFREKGVKKAFQELGLPLKKLPLIANLIREEFAKEIEFIKLYDGVKDLLFELKANGFKLGILTSNSQKNVLTCLKNNQIDCFEFVYSAKSLFGKAKVLKSLMAKYKLNKQQTFYIGDEIRDIQAAKKVGLKMIAVAWGFNTVQALREYNPDFLVNKPQEILRILS